MIDTSATREIDRIDDPSQSMVRIWTRVFRGSLFMPLLSELLCLASSIFVISKTMLAESSVQAYACRIEMQAKANDHD